MKHKVLITLLTILSLVSCQEKIKTITIDNWARTEADQSKTIVFLNDVIKSNDYLVKLSNTEILTKNSKSLALSSQANLIEMNTLGSLSISGENLGVNLEVRDTWYNAPKLSISSENIISISDVKTKLISKGIDIIDCGKFVYFYINGQVFSIKSEIHEYFNPPLPKNKSLLKVLFIGNSFNVDATTHLPGILKANGCDRIYMGQVYRGACTVPLYVDNYSNTSYCSYRVCRPGESKWDDDNEYNHSLKSAIEAEDWDIITFMEYTGNPVSWEWDEKEAKYFDTLINNIFEAHPNKRPTIMYMLTQTFALQHSVVIANHKAVVDKFGTDQIAMYNTITSFAQNVLNHTCIDDVIATGTAVQNLRTSRLNTDPVQDLSRDGFHLDYGVSRYAAACTVFYSIFEPVMGLSLENNSFRYSNKNDFNTLKSTPVTDDNVALCQKAARFATDKPFQITNMSNL